MRHTLCVVGKEMAKYIRIPVPKADRDALAAYKPFDETWGTYLNKLLDFKLTGDPSPSAQEVHNLRERKAELEIKLFEIRGALELKKLKMAGGRA